MLRILNKCVFLYLIRVAAWNPYDSFSVSFNYTNKLTIFANLDRSFFFKIVFKIFYTSSVRYRTARCQPNDPDSIIICKSYQVIRYRVKSRDTLVRDFITWPPPSPSAATSRLDLLNFLRLDFSPSSSSELEFQTFLRVTYSLTLWPWWSYEFWDWLV